MKIDTSRFGQIEVAESEIVLFPEGLLGFNEFHRYVILNTQEGSPFRWLQSLDDGKLAFVIIEPLSFMFSYDLEISDIDAGDLGLLKAEDVVTYAMVTIPENHKDMTANLQGPLIINVQTRRGRQVISNNTKHFLKTVIIKEMAKREQEMKKVQESLEPAKKDPESSKKGDKG